MISDPLLLLALLLAVVATTRWLEARFVWVERVSSAVVCTLLGIALANLGVIPHTSPTQAGVFRYAVPYAIVLILLGSDLRGLGRAGRPMVLMFVVASLGSFAGGVVAGVAFTSLSGPETWKVAGAFAGAFAGGGVNFAAVGQGLDIDTGLFAAAAVADNLSTVPYLLLQVALAGVLGRAFSRRAGSVSPERIEEDDGASLDRRHRWTRAELDITDLALLSAIPLGSMWIAGRLQALVPALPEVLWLTTLALALAQLPWIRRLKGSEMASYFALHLFFLVLGSASRVSEVVHAGLPIVGLMLAVLAVHVVVAYGGGWILKIDLPTVSLASQAAVGGPGTALALGMAMGWPRLVMPAVLVGIFGYALGNYLGFACAWLVAALV